MPQLTWLGDAEAKRAARRVSYRLLDPVETVGDRRPESGNVLTQAVWQAILDTLPAHDSPRLICGEAGRLTSTWVKGLDATFRQIPDDIRMR